MKFLEGVSGGGTPALGATMGRMAPTIDTSGLNEYLTRFSGQDDVLARVARETSERPNAMMQSRPDQGGFLTLLAQMLGAREALEVGTFTGYGAICIARGLADDGALTCLEVDADIAKVAQANIDAAGLSERVTIKVGPAADSIAAIAEVPQIDLVYIDADKASYSAYFEALVPRMRPGGVIVVDNTLLGGRVLEAGNERGEMMNALNEQIAGDDRVESVLLGLNDGMTLARKR
jgi:caffeoyl-CoA O-methyltransferase